MEFIIAILVVGVLAYLLFRNKSEVSVADTPLAPYKVVEPAPVVVEAAPVKKPRKPRAPAVAASTVKKVAVKAPAAKKLAVKAKPAALAKKPAAIKAKSKKG